MGLRAEPGEEIAATGVVDEVGVPPPETTRGAATFTVPRDGELKGEDRVEGCVGEGGQHAWRGGDVGGGEGINQRW